MLKMNWNEMVLRGALLLLLGSVSVGCGSSDGDRRSSGVITVDSNGQVGPGNSSGSATDSVSGPMGIDSTPVTSPECDQEGALFCNNECILPITDDHCNACNRKCGAGMVCRELETGYDCACPDGSVKCGGQCIDPTTSIQFCGASGTCTGAETGVDCGAGGACVDGLCQCDQFHTNCGGHCIDTLSNIEFCSPTVGDCGVKCMQGGVCVEGQCACPDSAPAQCANLGCVDPMSDVRACGGCIETDGVACDEANGFACVFGECKCPIGTTLCDGKCVNIAIDPDNCGGCYNDGAGPGIQCGFVAGTNDSLRQSCYNATCVDSPCDAQVVGTLCDGAIMYTRDICFLGDDHFAAGGIKCDNNSTSLNSGGIPKGQSACYEIPDVPDYTLFRCWWSGRPMTVNNQQMVCTNGGDNYQTLPTSVGGGYCVYIPPSADDGAKTDGFAIGNL